MQVLDRIVVAVVVLVLAAGGVASAAAPQDLDAALRAGDVPGVVNLLRDPLMNRGIWFPDAACAKRFGVPGRVAGADLPTFARCLVQLKLRASTSRTGDSSDATIFVYEPGIELDVDVRGPRIGGLGYMFESEWDRGRPTLTVQAFEALRKTGSLNIEDAVRGRHELLLRGHTTGGAWVKVCLDRAGAVERAATMSPTKDALVDAVIEDVTRTWTFRPFVLRGRTIPACSVLYLHFPAAAGPDPYLTSRGDLTLPEPPRKPVSPRALSRENIVEDLRIAGHTNIVPDDVTRADIRCRLLGEPARTSFRLCLDASGAMIDAVMLESSGFPTFDAKIRIYMRQWLFLPYRVRGKPVPVCTIVTFHGEPAPPPPPPLCIPPDRDGNRGGASMPPRDPCEGRRGLPPAATGAPP